jgi:sugar phosphate isomerase/epimerase
MRMITRREFNTFALGSLLGIDPRVAGVRVGVQTYSFRALPKSGDGDQVDAMIDAMRTCGFGECELWAPMVGRRTSPEELRTVKKKFDDAGIAIYAWNYSPNESSPDADLDRMFDQAKALGAEIITSSTTIAAARRIVPFAEKHKMVVAMHGHSNVSRPGEFASPESFAEALKMSKYFKVNLDIGHFTAANFDAVQYLREHHADITNLHIKDRKRNQGDNVSWGTGDTPIRDVLQLLKREKWPIRAYIEYEHKGEGTPVEEVRKCFAFMKQALV